MNSPQKIQAAAAQQPDRNALARRQRKADRELAKLGLAASLGVLVATGLSKNRSWKKLHVIAGSALVGLSIWHHLLYSSPKDNPRGDNTP